jgi:methionyl-tRNA synthetase
LGGRIPATACATELDEVGDQVVGDYQNAMDAHLLHEGGTAAWRLVTRANQFVEETTPWTLFKEGKQEDLESVLGSLARALARISLMALPFMPGKTQEVWSSLGYPTKIASAKWEELERPTVANQAISKLPSLFPKPAKTS